jgi:GMP synthase-like glutamine amidotransferase
MKENILLINICKEKLHFSEFVKPVGDVLIKNGIRGFIRHYTCLTKKDLEKASRVIICGTGLKDNDYFGKIGKFDWLKDFNRHVFGICGGMQIIGLVFGGKLDDGVEIGYYKEKFRVGFLGLSGIEEVYHLHNNYVDFSKLDFEVYSGEKASQAVKHRKKEIYGVLFHPEVRQKELILSFCKL